MILQNLWSTCGCSRLDLPGHLMRIYYAFVLQESIPVENNGCDVQSHLPQCFDYDKVRTCKPNTCTGVDISIVVGRRDSHLRDALDALIHAVNYWSHGEDLPAVETPERTDLIHCALVGSVTITEESERDHFDRCLGTLALLVEKLGIVTDTATRPISPEALYPIYGVLLHDGVRLTFDKFVVVGNEDLSGGRNADPSGLEAAISWASEQYMSPAHLFLRCRASARYSLVTRGDYVGSIINTAIAAEVLIKQTSWLLWWEEQPSDRSNLSSIPLKLLLKMPPGELINSILKVALGGSNWSSQSETSPIGAWRIQIARKRNVILHVAMSATREAAEDALLALEKLKSHIIQRILARRDEYPVTARLLADPLLSYTFQATSQQPYLHDYAEWLHAALIMHRAIET